MNQNRDPQGVPTGGQYATTPRADADVDLASGSSGQPFLVTVQPQEWINDHAFPDGDADTWDAAPYLRSLAPADRAKLVQRLEDGDDYAADDLYYGSAAMGLVQDGYGPFRVDVDTDELAAWNADAPAESATERRDRIMHTAGNLADGEGCTIEGIGVTVTRRNFLDTDGTPVPGVYVGEYVSTGPDAPADRFPFDNTGTTAPKETEALGSLARLVAADVDSVAAAWRRLYDTGEKPETVAWCDACGTYEGFAAYQAPYVKEQQCLGCADNHPDV